MYEKHKYFEIANTFSMAILAILKQENTNEE